MELQEKINDLNDNVAIKLLNTIAEPHTKEGEDRLPDDQAIALAEDFSLDQDKAELPDGDMARTALQVLARHPEHQSQVDQLIDTPDIRAFPAGTPMLDLENQTLVYVLKQAVDFERDTNGQVRAHRTHEPIDESLLKKYAGAVLSRVPGGPLRD